MKKYLNTIAVVEDDKKYQETLERFLKQYEKERNRTLDVDMYESADAFFAENKSGYDVILMDIEMPGTNGMEAAEVIRRKDETVVIMFITNLAHYAIRGYEVGALDFILKPIEYYNFATKLDRALVTSDNRNSKVLVLQTKNGIARVNSTDILYVEIQNRVLYYHTQTDVYQVRGSLKAAEEELPASMFEKCSNWCLIGLSHVSEIKNDTCVVGEKEIPISRRSKKSFMEALMKSVGRS